jgi:hypothetical protein
MATARKGNRGRNQEGRCSIASVNAGLHFGHQLLSAPTDAATSSAGTSLTPWVFRFARTRFSAPDPTAHPLFGESEVFVWEDQFGDHV